MADVFLSYLAEDHVLARTVAEALEAEGVSVWWKPAAAAEGTLDEAVEQQKRGARVVVGLWSPGAAPSEPAPAGQLIQTANLVDWSGDRADPRWQTFAADIIAKVRATVEPVDAPQDVESLFWASIKDSADPRDFRRYLKRYPDGAFANTARGQITEAHKRTAAWAVPIAVGAAIVMGAFLFVASRAEPAAAPTVAALDAGVAALAPPRNDMERFAREPDFLPAERVIEASVGGASLCANYIQSTDSCQSLTKYSRSANGVVRESETTRAVVRGDEVSIQTTAHVRVENGFVCYADPGAVEVSTTSRSLANQPRAVIEEATNARYPNGKRICMGFAGTPGAFRVTGFTSEGARIEVGERWEGVASLVAGSPRLRPQE